MGKQSRRNRVKPEKKQSNAIIVPKSDRLSAKQIEHYKNVITEFYTYIDVHKFNQGLKNSFLLQLANFNVSSTFIRNGFLAVMSAMEKRIKEFDTFKYPKKKKNLAEVKKKVWAELEQVDKDLGLKNFVMGSY